MVTTSPIAPQRRVPVHRSAKDKAPRACDLGLAEDWEEGASDEGCPVARDGVKESAVRVKEIVAGERGWVDAKAVRTAMKDEPRSQQDHGRLGGMLAGRIGKNKYVAEYAADMRSKCKHGPCKRQLLSGEFRIGKIPPRVNQQKSGRRVHWYHPECIFESFAKCSKRTHVIQSPRDLRGYAGLAGRDKRRVLLLMAEALKKRRALGLKCDDDAAAALDTEQLDDEDRDDGMSDDDASDAGESYGDDSSWSSSSDASTSSTASVASSSTASTSSATSFYSLSGFENAPGGEPAARDGLALDSDDARPFEPFAHPFADVFDDDVYEPVSPECHPLNDELIDRILAVDPPPAYEPDGWTPPPKPRQRASLAEMYGPLSSFVAERSA